MPNKRKYPSRHPRYTKEEFKEVLRALAKQRIGIPRSEETKAKCRAAHLGKKLSDEHKKAMGLSRRGKKQSPELIQKRIAPLIGRKRSDEVKEKLRLAQKKRYENHVYKTDESKLARVKPEYKFWREQVYNRDDWTCQKCHIKGGKLHPHHIRNFSEFTDLRYDVSNGITLCTTHHIEFHKIYGKKHNTEEQIKEYIA